MAQISEPWSVTAFRTPRDARQDRDPVARLRELRARILFDRGRRPAFRDPRQTFVDDQDLDYGAWHFVARRSTGGPPVGYVRLSTPDTGELFQTRAFLGGERYDALLRELGLDAAKVYEHSRLVVEHRARKLGLGIYLNATAIAAARHLGAQAMLGTSGTADGQDAFHGRFGFHPVAGTRRYVDQYTEDVVVMLYQVTGDPGEHAALVERLQNTFPAIVAPPQDEAVRAWVPSPPAEPVAPGRPRAAALSGWQPVLYTPANADERAALHALMDSGDVREVCDTIETQLDELVTSREPGKAFDSDGLRFARTDQLAGADAFDYGTWVWYPWSGRLVHLLPREEFRLVRTDRNRGRIERHEQRGLLDRRIGVVGLSVGSSAAVTLAMEGICGAFKLADFDVLNVSNLNRLRAGVHDIGLNKAVITARQLLEIDPYLDVEVHQDGLNAETIRDFFVGGHGPVDLLVEECDDPYAKVATREWARDLGIPVVMDANDRGMLDVERFDLEPTRPLLHGLLGTIGSADLLDLTFAEKVDLILDMVDRERISPELAAAIPQIGTTLSSWPQLASGVALGGALVTHAARRILLGKECPSGRYYTDLDALVAIERSTLS